MLAAHCGCGVVSLLVIPDLFEHRRMRLANSAVSHEQVNRLAVVEVVVKFAVRPEARKRLAIDEALLPKAAQPPERHILVAAHKADKL